MSISDKIGNDITKALTPYSKKIENEKDELKKAKLIHKAVQVEMKIFLRHIKNLKEKEFESLMNEITTPLQTDYSKFDEKVDTLMLKYSKSPTDFTNYQKRKKLELDHHQNLLQIIDDANLDKRGLERFLIFILMVVGDNSTKAQMEIIENLGWFEALNIVRIRFGYDQNWLIGMALIQLHENLIKKKLATLGFEIENRHKMPELISKLGNLIEEKEKRDVKLKLEMSQGLKRLRDVCSHQGYKYKITKTDITKITNEIKELDEMLYP